MESLPILDKRRTIAGPGYNRWLVPPAALAIHLSIGQVYAFSVFKIPLSRVIGITQSAPGDWTFPQLAWIFSIAIAVLGLSAAIWGRWLEDAGPRKAMFAAACCFGSGFLIAALGVRLHQLWLLYLGYGVVGGIGLGLGYISPVSTLIKWFIDRPGMATGLAIMGFGGGAMIGAPLSNWLMSRFHTATSNGVARTFLVMGIAYFVFMNLGAWTVRIPADGWRPPGYKPKAGGSRMITQREVDVRTAMHTRQFWLIWLVLCLNVTAGIGILEQASPMIQELFKNRVNAIEAGGFVGLLSLFNMLGRFFWSSLSDYAGRKLTYAVFFLLGAVLYVSLTFFHIGAVESVWLFVAAAAVVISMYGGGFATLPAYLRDLFGTKHVSAIHGRALTAWSTAGIVGPLLVNYIREHQIHQHVPATQAYALVLYIMAGLLAIGFVCNLLITPLPAAQVARGDSTESTPTRLPDRLESPRLRPGEAASLRDERRPDSEGSSPNIPSERTRQEKP